MKKIIVFFGIIFLLCSSLALAEKKPVVAAADPWPPFIDPESPDQGLSMEIVRAAFETQGYQVALEVVPWARAESGVGTGAYDILPNTWKTDERMKVLSYSQPYASNQIKFIKKKDNTFEYDGIGSLAGKTVGTIRGYGYGTDFLDAPGFAREEVDSLMTNVKKLVAGRIDLTLADEVVAKVSIGEKDKALLDKIAFTKKALSKNDLFVTCGLKNPRHKELIDAFNKGLEEIKTSGRYAEIFKKYGIQ